MVIKHGGNLLQIANRYESNVKDWLDLSTGVSPFTYPISVIPNHVWNQLPQANDGLEAAAKIYYSAPNEPVAVAGSQAAIMLLPRVLMSDQKSERCVVALPRVGYKEHEHAWRTFEQNNSHWQVLLYEEFPTSEQVERSDVVLVINPNNPSGQKFSRAYLKQLHQSLKQRNRTLIVDEAFADIPSQQSMLTPDIDMDNLIVLRSVGKFFGLAGARVGFVFANTAIKQQIEELMGPWTVTGPSRWVMKQALLDSRWQSRVTKRIQQASERLNQLLENTFSFPRAGTDLFTTVYTDDAIHLHDQLCRLNILVRLCDEKNALRFGLPEDEFQWQKLESALLELKQKIGASQ